MSQDTKTFLGFVLIAVIVLIWMSTQSPAPKTDSQPATADSVKAHVDSMMAVSAAAAAAAPVIPDSVRVQGKFGGLFTPFTTGTDKKTVIHTSLYTAEVSTLGGGLRQFELSNYKTWNHYPVEMIDGSRGSQVNLTFESSDGKLISTKDLYFASSAPPEITVSHDSTVVSYVLAIDSNRSIEKIFTFHDGTYIVDAEFVFTNCGTVILNNNYRVTWDNGIPFAEANSIDECTSAEATCYQNGELTTIDAAKLSEPVTKQASGITNWVAMRTKYFAAALIATKPAEKAYLDGNRVGLPDNGAREEYDLQMQYPYRSASVEHSHVKVYIGPMDYQIVKGLDVDLEKIMSFGWAWIIRPIGIYFMLPVFNFIHMFIPNYGFVIIIFSIFIKALLYPLSINQLKSAKKMKLMQPMMAEMGEKYKDDPAKKQSETMKLYSTYGINPMGGCLPLLLQMPILYAMWALLRNAIQLRQSSFAFWITDLSIPDIAIHLPFRIPLFGIDQLSGLALMMGVAIFVQQKMTMVSNPQQKMMMYVMPVMLTLMFASFPSGLNLYYLMFNLLSIGQQAYFNKAHSEITLVAVKKDMADGTAKLTFTQRILAAQKQAANKNNGRSAKTKGRK